MVDGVYAVAVADSEYERESSAGGVELERETVE